MMREDLTGRKFNMLTVIEFAQVNHDRSISWKCICDCGQATIVKSSYLRKGHTKSCGCLQKTIAIRFAKDITGLRSGKLVAVRATDKRSSGKVVWECKCDCGNIAYVQSTKLIHKNSKSCGCYSSEKTTEMNLTHGLTGTRLYSIWASMKTRCNNPRRKCYSYYGGRGITVCYEWENDFTKFYEWAVNNGYSDVLTLDRKDCDKGYSPDNCRWATWHEQRINQRRNNSHMNDMEVVI
jgi:hypothetical protein